MGKSKRKNVSPLQKDAGKSRRTGEDEAAPEAEEDSLSQGGWNDGMMTDLKEFIRREIISSNQALTENMRKYNEERVSALESSLSFALATNETLAKRLSAVEARASQAESDFRMCVKRMSELEQELDQLQQTDLRDWLVFSGPAIPRASRSDRSQDVGRLLRSMLQQLMSFSLDMQQVAELRREERLILVRFSTSAAGSDRYLLIRNKTRLRGTGLYIREKLTPARQQIFNKLMQLKREDKVSTVFTRDGTVFVVVGQRGRPRPVRSEVALERLTRELAEMSAGHLTAGQPDRRTPRVEGDSGAAGGSPMPWSSPSLSTGAVASRSAGGSGSSPGYTADGAGRSAERERSAVCDGRATEAARERRSATPAAGVLTAMDCGGSVPGSGGMDRSRVAPDSGLTGGDEGDGAGTARDDGVTGDDEGGECSRHRAVVSGESSASTSDARPGRGAAGVRHRFGGDIRQFIRGHSKCD